ncbi:DUF1360 domain-containing protein [Conexibacter arvalis]|uniref:DUF1360 domain-containing protein n=1 Tax=Conexibacter arvalis TaxID=912552 RepID=A0A840IGM8_9ACTN|nr:DUF1360 domain-containing protein [Conexibacter arvalis]MBB4664207.1 hypothetical protein [Conexibacter arvalis]
MPNAYHPPGDKRPLVAYATLTGAFGASVGAAALANRRAGRSLPERIGVGDLLLLGVATHKLSRLIARDKVTSFARAPFTRFQEPAGHGEVEEQPRGSGLRLAIGELLVCPYCLAQWIAAGLVAGYVAAPRQTRAVATVYAAETISDFLQAGYRAAVDRA